MGRREKDTSMTPPTAAFTSSSVKRTYTRRDTITADHAELIKTNSVAALEKSKNNLVSNFFLVFLCGSSLFNYFLFEFNKSNALDNSQASFVICAIDRGGLTFRMLFVTENQLFILMHSKWFGFESVVRSSIDYHLYASFSMTKRSIHHSRRKQKNSCLFPMFQLFRFFFLLRRTQITYNCRM